MLSNNLIRISAAGSGKTWQICHDALKAAYAGERSLITTYTHKGLESIKDEICKQNAGILHENIDIFSWFQFLFSELIRPYQTTIFGINEVCGFDFSKTYGVINYHKTGTKKRYLNQSGQIRSNYASELALQIIKLSQGNPIRRLEKCYKFLFIDEIQDLAGYDIEILGLLLKTGLTVICAGDNKQATYKTHNAKKYKDKTGQNIWAFFKVVEDKGYARIERNLKSRRCNKFICSFANTVFSNENNISSIMDVKTGHDGVFLINKDDANKYWSVYSPQVLRYDIKTNVGAYIVSAGLQQPFFAGQT